MLSTGGSPIDLQALALGQPTARSGGDCEDVVQEVFLVVGSKLPRFDGRAEITTWLYEITVRAAELTGHAGARRWLQNDDASPRR